MQPTPRHLIRTKKAHRPLSSNTGSAPIVIGTPNSPYSNARTERMSPSFSPHWLIIFRVSGPARRLSSILARVGPTHRRAPCSPVR